MATSLLLPRLRPDQWAIVSHPAKTKVVAIGRRWGKTITAGAVALSAAAQGARVLWLVPTYRNARPLWRWAEAVTAPLVRRGLADLNRTERMLEFPDGGFLGIYSGDNDAGIRGEWFNLAILEEAALLREESWTDVVQPTLADAQGDAILISTPKGKNWFWREWQRGVLQMDDEIAAFTAPSSANPNPNIQRAAALARQRVPDSTYRQEWLAEFVEEATQPYSPAWFAERRYDPQDQRLRNGCVARWISWDTAFKDKDDAAFSAAVVGELTADYRLLIREVWRDRLTFPHLVAQIERLATKYGQDTRTGSRGLEAIRKLQAVVIEDRATGISAYQTLTETAEPWLRPLLVPFEPQGSKEQRAELAAVWCEQGCVWLPRPDASVPWLYPFEEELYAFPQAPFMDQVDAFSQLVLYVSRWLQAGHEARARATALVTAAAG
jgi:predicted phage terminase large subunit-like protein